MRPGILWVSGRLLPFIAAAIYVAVLGTPWENTFTFAAEGRLDLHSALFYRFRDGSLLAGFGWAEPAVGLLLATIKLFGSRALWVILCISTGALSARRSLGFVAALLCLVTTGVLLDEAILLWSLFAALLAEFLTYLRTIRSSSRSSLKKLIWALCACGLLVVIAMAYALANPLHTLQRHRVLGGKSIADRLHVYTGRAAFSFDADCVALLNPDDLHGVNAVELIDRLSLRRLAKTTLLDLKLVERNYTLLYLKNEKGQYIFSDAARDFAKVEAAYAANAQQLALAEPRLCLVAAFDTHPEKEEAPFSRARIMIEARKKAGKDTQVIQLPRW